jgi:hypothetical protein
MPTQPSTESFRTAEQLGMMFVRIVCYDADGGVVDDEMTLVRFLPRIGEKIRLGKRQFYTVRDVIYVADQIKGQSAVVPVVAAVREDEDDALADVLDT